MTDELSTSAWRDIAPNRDARDSMPPVRTRLLALALVFALLAVTILSPIAAAHELHHDCTGAGCTICAELAGNLSIARPRGRDIVHHPLADLRPRRHRHRAIFICPGHPIIPQGPSGRLAAPN